MSSSAHPTTAVVGAGAVGSFFGALLARAGNAVTLIGRAPHVQAIRQHGLELRMAGQVQHIPMQAGTHLAAVNGADLVLVCVKSPDTEDVARQLAPLLSEDALVLSLQNGVDNAERLTRHLPHLRQPVIPAVVYVATSMPAPGVVSHHGRGELVLGPSRPDGPWPQRLQAVVRMFAAAGVPVQVSDEAMAALWRKLLLNCAYNAISGLTQARYGQMAAQPEVRRLMTALVHEVLAVAHAAGQALDADDALAATLALAETMPAQQSSTAQDMARGKPSEIDHLNGYVLRRGAELGVPTPLNHALWALVKLAEEVRAA